MATPTEPSDPSAEPSETPTEPPETPAEPSDPPAEPSDPPAEPSDPPAEPPTTATTDDINWDVVDFELALVDEDGNPVTDTTMAPST